MMATINHHRPYIEAGVMVMVMVMASARPSPLPHVSPMGGALLKRAMPAAVPAKEPGETQGPFYNLHK